MAPVSLFGIALMGQVLTGARPVAFRATARTPSRASAVLLAAGRQGGRRGRGGSSGSQFQVKFNPAYFTARDASNQEGARDDRKAGSGRRRNHGHGGAGRRATPGGEPSAASQRRQSVHVGVKVSIVQKHHQSTGERTLGDVARVLTNSQQHPRGIKVMLTTGEVGRVHDVVGPASCGANDGAQR